MQIYLRDRTKQGTPTTWEQALQSEGAFQKCFVDAKPDSYVPGRETDAKNGTAIVFLHASGDDLKEEWKKGYRGPNPTFQGHLVLIQTEGHVRALNADDENARIHGCWWKPADFANPTRHEVMTLIDKIKKGEDDWWKFLQPSGAIPENLLAWTLCQVAGIQLPSGISADDVKSEFESLSNGLRGIGRLKKVSPPAWTGELSNKLQAAKELIVLAREDI